MSEGATELITAAAVVGMAMETPISAMTSGSTNAAYPGPFADSSATEVRPSPCSSIPVIISGRAPIRSAIRRASGAATIGVAVQGRKRNPVASGE